MSYCKAGFACLCSVRESFTCSNQVEGEPSPEHEEKQRAHYAEMAARKPLLKPGHLSPTAKRYMSKRETDFKKPTDDAHLESIIEDAQQAVRYADKFGAVKLSDVDLDVLQTAIAEHIRRKAAERKL